MRNHNHLLGNVAGVDGIKTGYIHDSGFNIVISVAATTAISSPWCSAGAPQIARDARVASLMDSNIASPRPNARRRYWSKAGVAEGDQQEEIKRKGNGRQGEGAAARPTEPAHGSTEPIKPNPVKTFTVHPAPCIPRHSRLCPRLAAS